MNQYRTATVYFCWIILAICIAWDVMIYRKGGVDATISRVLWNAVKAYPGLAIAIGALLGHLFFSQTALGLKSPMR